jgi:hypothetical protein
MIFDVSPCGLLMLQVLLLYMACHSDTFSSKTNRNDMTHTMRDSYQQHSGHQYLAHENCQDLLVSCMEQLDGGLNFEDMYGMGAHARQRVMANLVLDNVPNSIRMLQIAMNALSNNNPPFMWYLKSIPLVTGSICYKILLMNMKIGFEPRMLPP